MQLNNTESAESSLKNPANFLAKSKIKTFRKLDRKGSVFHLFKDAISLKSNLLDLPEKRSFASSKHSNESECASDSFILKSQKKIRTNLILNDESKVRYKQKKLPILTKSNQLLTEAEFVNSREKYYIKNLGRNKNIFGRKYAILNNGYRAFETKNEEEFIQAMGLNDEEKDPLRVIQGKKYDINMQYEKENFDNKNIKFRLFHHAQQKIGIKDNIYKAKITRKEMLEMKLILSQFKEETTKKREKLFSFYKKDEFSDFLITNYLKEKYPKLLDNSDKLVNHLYMNANTNNIKRRKIYVIKNSTIIYNSKTIPGFLVEIPTVKEMNKYSSNKKKIIMNQFYEFITKKFQTKYKLNLIFKKNRNIIPDFGSLSPSDKYIYVSHKSIYEGLLFPLNKNLINTYIKHFKEKERDKYYFNESSFEEKSCSEKEENSKINDDIYDLYFNNDNNNKIKTFKKKLKNKKTNLNKSYTFGFEDKDNYEYIYYSDNETRIKNFQESEYKIYKNNNLYFYINSQNQVYDTKIKDLLAELSSNKSKRRSTTPLFKKYHKPKDELIKDYLTEKKLPEKNILKSETPKKLTNQAILEAFNLLKTQDETMDVNKFIKTRTGAPFYLPYVRENIIENSNKYYFSRRKLDKHYPSTLSYNFPKVVETRKKYKLADLIKYYTKFKSLLNLWLNMHPFAEVTRFGIDFDTFISCTEEICEEEETFAKKIFNRINTGTSGILSLEDYVDGLIALNSNILTEQIEFFIKIFNSRGKTYFNYKEIFDISKMSIKRLIKIKNKLLVDTVSEDLGGYLADFIFNICESKREKGIEIKKLKDVLENDKEHGEFLKLFMCFFGDKKFEKNLNNIDRRKYEKKFRDNFRKSIALQLKKIIKQKYS